MVTWPYEPIKTDYFPLKSANGHRAVIRRKSKPLQVGGKLGYCRTNTRTKNSFQRTRRKVWKSLPPSIVI